MQTETFDERHGKMMKIGLTMSLGHITLSILAIELGLYEQLGITMYYKKGGGWLK